MRSGTRARAASWLLRRQVRLSDPTSRWSESLGAELDFWRGWFETGGAGWPADFARRLDPDLPLGPPLNELVERIGLQARILDVGSGPLTSVGRTCSGRRLDITAVDALADSYNALMDQKGVVPPVRPTAVETERLAEHFPQGSFDITHARNTLDHAYDPLRAVGQMAEVTRTGGHVVLVHRNDEGEGEGYQGLHQWNFRVRDGELVLWRPGTAVSLTTQMASKLRQVEAVDADAGWHQAVFVKTA